MKLIKKNNGTSHFPSFVDSVFENFFNENWPTSSGWNQNVAKVNISETEESYHVELAAPGMKRDDFKIEIEGDLLSISAETKTENTETDKKYNRKEWSYSSFKRSFTLPENVDEESIKAGYTDGILTIDIPKSEKENKGVKTINIS